MLYQNEKKNVYHQQILIRIVFEYIILTLIAFEIIREKSRSIFFFTSEIFFSK